MEKISRNKCFVHVRVSHVLLFACISICGPFADPPSQFLFSTKSTHSSYYETAFDFEVLVSVKASSVLSHSFIRLLRSFN
jgi:hypothetical protein